MIKFLSFVYIVKIILSHSKNLTINRALRERNSVCPQSLETPLYVSHNKKDDKTAKNDSVCITLLNIISIISFFFFS